MTSIDLHWGTFLKKGDSTSFSRVFEMHVDNLIAYGRSFGFQQEVCKDAIQDVFYKIYIARDSLSHVENITAYIFKSYKNRLHDLATQRNKEEFVDSISELSNKSFTMEVSVLDHMIEREKLDLLKEKVTNLLNELNANQREIVYLKYMVGLSHKEISEILNIQEESARKLLYRSIMKLREKFTEKEYIEVLNMFPLLFLFHK